MWINYQRLLLFTALLLDLLGQFLIFSFFQSFPFLVGIDQSSVSFHSNGSWLLFVSLLYPLLGWLFGSYTVLFWRRLTFTVLLQRVLLTSCITFIFVSFLRGFFNPLDTAWFFYRHVQVLWIGFLSVWAILVRICLRNRVLLPDPPKLILFANVNEFEDILFAWHRVPHRQKLHPVDSFQLEHQLHQTNEPILVALSSSVYQDAALRPLISSLEMRTCSHVNAISVLSLFEQYQERLPPLFMPDAVLSYDDLPWAATFSVQSQLKRTADLFVSVFLLLITSPFVLLAAFMIWLEDQGPVLYTQQRTGWMGRPFTLYKLRTMKVQPDDAPALWTQPGDHRITRCGELLRRLRLDELPQLFNVLSGEMSLIGPRPERPELEKQLEERIPHYRKRHWMRPGLSGWAQVFAPYASSISDSDLKLSYDLYYLRHFSTWLDLVILFRTIKTVLKAGGR